MEPISRSTDTTHIVIKIQTYAFTSESEAVRTAMYFRRQGYGSEVVTKEDFHKREQQDLTEMLKRNG
jgi:hypothetical protein